MMQVSQGARLQYGVEAWIFRISASVMFTLWMYLKYIKMAATSKYIKMSSILHFDDFHCNQTMSIKAYQSDVLAL